MSENYRQPIHNVPQILKAVELAIEIQNAGIATVFSKLSGHVSLMEIDLHYPWWNHGSANEKIELSCSPDEEDNFHSEHNRAAIIRLNEILEAGPDSQIVKDAIEKQQAAKRAEYERLKKEFEPEDRDAFKEKNGLTDEDLHYDPEQIVGSGSRI